MKPSEITINELISRIISEMKRMGYSDYTIWNDYAKRFYLIRRYYHNTVRTYYDPDTTDEYVSLRNTRYEDGEISYDYYRIILRAGKMLNAFFLTGEIRISMSFWKGES